MVLIERAALREFYTTITSGAVRDPATSPRAVMDAYERRLAEQLAHHEFWTTHDLADALEAAGHPASAALLRAAALDVVVHADPPTSGARPGASAPPGPSVRDFTPNARRRQDAA